MDLAGVMSRVLGKSTPARTQPGITMGLGFSGETAAWRITVPTPQILGTMAVAQSRDDHGSRARLRRTGPRR